MAGAGSAKLDGDVIMVRPLLTARDVARLLAVGERTVWRMASRARAGDGALPRPVRVGEKAIRWRWEDMQEYLRKLAGKPLDVSARPR